ncbi:50S ribosomal protein L33 [Caldibacillus lycopersici]|uniref:Large ribosomal subunit protein bL33 n=1 Tax=Perspicuibacillus lycopersici TaxID=1325689 RepID=A0AAE3IV76_9BACI|nr:50S ribosomal protein L33 [Perspicuibacillus lycopersici]
MSKKIILACEKCGSRNYKTVESKDNSVRFELKKYCPNCRLHTIHRQT